MKRKLTIAGFILLLFLALFSALKNREEKVKLRLEPSYYFHYQRAYPNREIPEGAVRRARQQAMALRERAKGRSAPQWQEVGPYNIGGRITAVAADPTNPDIVYFGAADGGVFKSTDGGSSWEPIFDEVGVMSIGAIAVDPTDPDKIYVGTGEANSSGDSFDGEGIFLSEDGGQTWTRANTGLNNLYVGTLFMHPENPDILLASGNGPHKQDRHKSPQPGGNLRRRHGKALQHQPGKGPLQEHRWRGNLGKGALRERHHRLH